MSGARNRLVLIGPAILAIGGLLVVPLGIMAYVSTLQRGDDGGVLWHRHTVGVYVHFLFDRDLFDNVVLNTDYIRIFFSAPSRSPPSLPR